MKHAFSLFYILSISQSACRVLSILKHKIDHLNYKNSQDKTMVAVKFKA